MKSIIKLVSLFTLILLLFFNCTFKKGLGDYINKGALYVSIDGNDDNDGTLYTPVRTVKQGLKLLRQEGYKTLKVSKGIYYESEPIVIDASVTIDGGWNEDFSDKTSLLEDSDYSIISGNNLLTNLITISNATDVELKGLLICDTVQGAVMPSDDSSIVIRNSEEIRLNSLIFQNNSANRGGALFIGTSRRIYIDRNSFLNNRAEQQGGAVATNNSHFLYFSNTRFQNNHAKQRGGAFYSAGSARVYFDKGEFIGNSSDTTGGGLSFETSSNIRVADSLLQGNRVIGAAGNGGAIEITEARDFIINNNRFLENEAFVGSDISLMLTEENLTRGIRGNKIDYFLSQASVLVRIGANGDMNRFYIENNNFKLLSTSSSPAYAFMEESPVGGDLKLHTFNSNKFINYGGKKLYLDINTSTDISTLTAINDGSKSGAATSGNEIIN